MNRWIIFIITALVGASCAGLYLSYSGKAAPEKDSFVSYVPADTVYYFGGETPDALAEFFLNMPLSMSSPSQAAQTEALVQAFDNELTPGTPRSIASFLKFANGLEGKTLGDFTQELGLANSGEYAIYSHGIAPVIRTTLASEQKLQDYLNRISAENDWKYDEQVVDSTTIKLWPLSKPEEAEQVYLVVASNASTATMTLLSSADDDNVKWQRLGMVKPEVSLATSQELNTLKQQYSFDNLGAGFFHIKRIVEGVLDPNANSFGKQLYQYMPENKRNEFLSDLAPACRQDILSLVSGAPRYVAGYTKAEVKGENLSLGLAAILEISNTKVAAELQKLSGHIPEHALGSNKSLLSFGVGSDADNFVPALTELWTMFVNAEFQCPELQQAQIQARQSSPAMLAMFMGMAQGVKGAGISIHDVAWENEGTPIPSKVSAIASVAATNPETLSGMATTMVPMLAGLQIPTDGSATTIPLPLPGIEVKAAIKGKQLVVYTSDDLEPTLANIANESLDANGMYALSVNYQKLYEIGSKAPTTLDPKSCMTKHEVLHMFSSQPFAMSFLLNQTARGAEASIDLDVTPIQASTLTLPGSYKFAYLDDSCQWVESGIEVISEDGTGNFTERDENDQCDIYKLSYAWEKQANKIILTPSEEFMRETCDAELEAVELETYTCHLMNITDNSFQCMYDPGTDEATLYRYTRQ